MNSEQIWEKIQKGVFVIAEAGKNFIQTEEEKSVAEYLKNAKDLVDKAVWAGADAIKFQTHEAEDEQHPDIKVTASHFQALDRYSWVTRNERATPVENFWRPLREYCEEKGIVFFSTPMSRGAARRLMRVGMPLWKIGSGDILDWLMLDYIRNTKIPIIMSSGASSLEEVERSFNFLREKNPRCALVHTLSKYPGEPEEENLATIYLYREMFPGVPIGFSENSVGIEPSCIAVAEGATIIEKHFSPVRGLWGADHKVCSTPEEFKAMVEEIREMEKSSSYKMAWVDHPKFAAILGKKEKVLREDEAGFRPVFQKSLVAGRDIPAGTVINTEMIYAMRPRKELKGLPSEQYEQVLGRVAKNDIKKYDPINWEALA